jgi:hypothetical protein
VLVKRFFFLLNAAFAMAILDLISQVQQYINKIIYIYIYITNQYWTTKNRKQSVLTKEY